MKELTTALAEALPRTRFRSETGNAIEPQSMRQAIADDAEWLPHIREILTARPTVPMEDIERISELLRGLLKQYWQEDEDRIEHTFRVLGDDETHILSRGEPGNLMHGTSTIPTLAKALVRSAGFIGPERAAWLICELAGGAPIKSKMMIVLNDTWIDQPTELHPGVRLYRLPTSSQYFRNAMPDIHHGHVAVSMLGRTVLEVETERTPAFFQPGQASEDPLRWHVKTALDPMGHQALLDAISLASHRMVEADWIWHEQDITRSLAFPLEVSELWASSRSAERELRPNRTTERQPGMVKVGNGARTPDYTSPSPNLFARDAERAWSVCPEMTSEEFRGPRMYVAIRQWMQAVSSLPGMIERMVGLRIALEALYVDSGQGELGFRMSLIAAHHLGETLTERKDIQSTLNKFYGLASRAVHGKMVLNLKETDRVVIDQATILCAEGILKVLNEKKYPDWKELLL